MTGKNDNKNTRTYASPPCFMHEVDPTYMNLPVATSSEQDADVKRCTKATRERLIKKRLSHATDIRRKHGA